MIQEVSQAHLKQAATLSSSIQHSKGHRSKWDVNHFSIFEETGESLHEGLERPLHEILKVKPGLYWRPHDREGARALGCLQGRAANKEWK